VQGRGTRFIVLRKTVCSTIHKESTRVRRFCFAPPSIRFFNPYQWYVPPLRVGWSVLFLIQPSLFVWLLLIFRRIIFFIFNYKIEPDIDNNNNLLLLPPLFPALNINIPPQYSNQLDSILKTGECVIFDLNGCSKFGWIINSFQAIKVFVGIFYYLVKNTR
jgi:hypothetical protein